jgi:hypothetical protein
MAEKFVGKKKIIADLILISALLLVALSVFLCIELTREAGSYVRVTVDGVECARYSLSDDGEYVINGGTNLLVIENGKAYMKYADCPDGLCVQQGEKSRSGERIVCLPNRVMVEIVSDDTDGEILEV